MSKIEFRDLKRQYNYLKESIDTRIFDVVSGAHFIGGAEVNELEHTLADYVGRRYCISCGNGTDAISIALMAAGVGNGDAVFVPDFTFFSSGECPATVGATPIFVDVNLDTYNISEESLEKAIKGVVQEGKLTPKAVIAVDLFGQPFDYERIKAICDKYNLLLFEDAAQGFGGEYTGSDGRKIKAGKLGVISTTSFFPAKPLGCYGDGGAIFTDDDNLAILCRSIAVHGKDMEHPNDPNAKYNNVRLGMNSRLDTVQAAILLAKFPTFVGSELDAVNHVAERYFEGLGNIRKLTLPYVACNCYSSWAQFTIQLSSDINRTKMQNELKGYGIPTNVYYIKPMHLQSAFEDTRSSIADCPNVERLCESVLCLPIHPYLDDYEVDFIVDKVRTMLD